MKIGNLPTIQSSDGGVSPSLHQFEWRKMLIASLLVGGISSQVDIQTDQVFMDNNSILFNFSAALYPGRVAVMPNLEGATEILPHTIKQTGFNLVKTNKGLVLFDYHNHDLVAITFQKKVGKILVWESGTAME